VTDNHGSPVGVSIYARGESNGYAYANSDGSYEMDHLLPGDYKLSFYYYGREFYWNSEGGSFEETEAEPVHIDGDQVLSGIDFIVPRMGSITGRVTDREGQPLTAGCR
jgi:protocatechuate 3,4-dioxygenase beta subunit